MICMCDGHIGPVLRTIFVPAENAKGHGKIKGPLICERCYESEFGKTDFLPEQIWVQPAGQSTPCQLSKILPSIAPKDALEDPVFLAEVANWKRDPAIQASMFDHQMKRIANDVRKKEKLRYGKWINRQLHHR